MSRWEQDQTIDAQFSAANGELLLSASDVVAWLRWCAISMEPKHLYTPGVMAVADALASNLIDATRPLVDGSES